MRSKGTRWYVLALIGLVTVINYIDRNALAIMWQRIGGDLAMDKADYANIVSLFMIAYAVSHTVSGRIFDWVGTRWGFVLAIVVWSVACILHGFSAGVFGFCICRMLLGFGEAGNWPGATKSNAEWFSVTERATAQGVFGASASVGAVVSAPLVAYLYLQVGWRFTFILMGAAGLLWIIPWLWINRGGPRADAAGLTGVSTSSAEEERPTVLGLLSLRQSWAIMMARFFIDPVWWLFLVWLPLYLTDSFGFDIRQIGLFSWIPYAGGALGALTGGALAGWLIRHGWSVDRARKSVIVVGGIFMFVPLYPVMHASAPLLAVTLIALVLFGFQFAMTNIQTLISDVFSGRSIGTIMGLSGTSSTIGVLLATQLVPIITRNGYGPLFLLAAAAVPLGILSVFTVGKIQQIQQP